MATKSSLGFPGVPLSVRMMARHTYNGSHYCGSKKNVICFAFPEGNKVLELSMIACVVLSVTIQNAVPQQLAIYYYLLHTFW